MHFGTMKITGIEIPVEITDEGRFTADLGGEQAQSDTLQGLKRNALQYVKTMRLNLPFVTTSGNRGTLRGYHASQNKLLVTFENGTKTTMDYYHPVFVERTAEQIEELRKAREQLSAAQERVKELTEDTVQARELYDGEIAEMVKGWGRNISDEEIEVVEVVR